MLSKEAFDQAYQNGVAAALNEWGLTKTALVGELGSKTGGWLSANPAIQRALIGAGVGGAVGGATDIGAGRGMLAGGLAGAGSVLGQRVGQKMVRQGYKSELASAAKGTKALPGQAARGQMSLFNPAVSAPVQGPIRSREALENVIQQYTGGAGARGLQQTINRGGLTGGLGLGTALGGGALMASQPPPPKPWYAGLMGG